MKLQGTNGHNVSQLTTHVVWLTKYRYLVLDGDVKVPSRTNLILVYESEDVVLLKGVASRDHIHMPINYRPSLIFSDVVKKLKGCSSRKLLQEFPEL